MTVEQPLRIIVQGGGEQPLRHQTRSARNYFGDLHKRELLTTISSVADRKRTRTFFAEQSGMLRAVGTLEVHKVLEIQDGRAILTGSQGRHRILSDQPLVKGASFEVAIDPGTNDILWAQATDVVARELGGAEVKMSSPVDKLRSISQVQAREFFDVVRRQPHIPFQYPVSGCWARAHEVCRIIERHLDKEPSDVVAKAWNYGDLKASSNNTPACSVEWYYHVTPIVRVDGALTALDPSLFDTPVPLEHWRQVQNDPNATLAFTNWLVYFRGKSGSENAEAPYEAETDMQEMRARLFGQIYASGPIPYKCPSA
jgi:hypothetical protein